MSNTKTQDKNSERNKFLDTSGRPLTQSLFLELAYKPEALYSLKDYDCEYNGKTYPSIKLLYIECGDVTEYDFANKYFLNWSHWQRICANQMVRKHIDEWRMELEVKLRSLAIKETIKLAQSGNSNAAKWIADRGWSTRGAGRPSSAEVERERKVQAAIEDNYTADILRLKRV